MGRLLETIKIQDGIIQNIIYHNQRFNRSRRAFWPDSVPIDLYEHIKIPKEYQLGTIRCRVLYQAEIEVVQFLDYVKQTAQNLKLVETNIDYSYKWEDRAEINNLVADNSIYDDILMVKNGLITDTSYANIVFEKNGNFYTPKTPMLPGTKRQKLLDEKSIIELDISPSEITNFSGFALINAFNDLEKTTLFDIKNIK
jgi:4-amino-4-deoxychorismate lyase